MNIYFMLKQMKTTVAFLFISSILFGLLYPGVVTLILHFSCQYRSNGSILYKKNLAIGSELIGQYFDNPKYFWGRPSATSPLPYDPSDSKGSNLCPANPKLISLINERVHKLKKMDTSNTLRIPVDLVTASASGLDPHISIASAYYQLERVARARNIDPKVVKDQVDKLIIPRQLGFLGEPRINVLQLNLALDQDLK